MNRKIMFWLTLAATLFACNSPAPVHAQTPPPPTPLPSIPPQATLTWGDTSNNEDGFKVYRRIGNAGTVVWSQVGSTGVNIATYIDKNLLYSTTYCWAVTAWNAGGESAKSPEACGLTKAAPPPPAVIPNTPGMPTLLLQ